MVTPADTSLLLDAMLGKLATYLRMCGYDAAYALDRGIEDDAALLELAREEGRRLLTRDRELAERAERSVLLSEREIEGHLTELLDTGFRLALAEPRRCSVCNGRLERVSADKETPKFAPTPAEQPVWRCQRCGQPFWRGSHWQDVEATLAAVRARRG